MKKIILSVCLLAASIFLNAQTEKFKDSKFADDAAQAGLLEVKLGQLAVSKATSDEVRSLGQSMVDDHTKANNELMALAVKKNVTLLEGLSKEGQMHYDELSKTNGTEFDKRYSEMMVKDHEMVVSKFKSESASGKDADFKAWATATLPTLEHHLMMSKDTCKKFKK